MTSVTVIDDEAGLVELMELILTSRGFQVHGITDPLLALDHLCSEPPDVVLLDLMMPGLSGWELLQRMERTPQTAGLPVILISACPELQPGVLEWSKAHAVTFLHKPFDIEHLMHTLTEMLQQAEQPEFRQRLSRRRRAMMWVS